MSPYLLCFGNAFYLPMEIENKRLWALKKLNLYLSDAANLRYDKINELNEFHLHAYERATLYKDKMILYHDKHIA